MTFIGLWTQFRRVIPPVYFGTVLVNTFLQANSISNIQNEGNEKDHNFHVSTITFSGLQAQIRRLPPLKLVVNYWTTELNCVQIIWKHFRIPIREKKDLALYCVKVKFRQVNFFCGTDRARHCCHL